MSSNSADKLEHALVPVTGMSCAACAGSVESMLNGTVGVNSAAVNFGTAVVDIDYQPNMVSLAELKQTIQSIGYDLIIEDEEDKKQEAIEEARSKEYQSLVKRTIISNIFTIPIMIISMGFPDINYANLIMLLLTLPVIIWSGRSFYSRTVLQLKHRMVTMDTLVSLSTSIAFVYSLVVTIFPELLESRGVDTHVYYEASAVIISFVLFGKLLEERAKSNTSSAIRKLMNLQPEFVDVEMEDGNIKAMSVKHITPGMQVIIKPGDQVPVDGIIISGDSYIDESMITGEPLPVYKSANSKVFAGTINGQGRLLALSETKGSETLLAKIIQMVQRAQGSKAHVQKLADKIAAVFVPVVLGIALLTFLSWIIFGGENNLTYALITSISVLVIACPCALGLATPTAIIVGMGRGAENHILIKDADALEMLNKVSFLVFDKTGTLTEGKPEVVKVDWHRENKSDIEKFSKVLKLLEGYSDHPLSHAIKERFSTFTSAQQLDKFEDIPGRGIKGQVDGEEYFTGNRQFLIENGVILNDVDSFDGSTQVLLAAGKNHVATIYTADKIKDSAAESITILKKAGFETMLLTGDNDITAKSVSERLGIKKYHAELLPHEKAEIIGSLQNLGHKVAMIGDGINDSEALSRADIGIAMGSGSDIAIETAQITLRSNDPALIIKAVALAQQSSSTIKQNLFWAFVYNLIGIPLAAGLLYSFNGFLLNPMIAAGAMALSSVSVVTNSLLLKRKQLKLKKINFTNSKVQNMETYRFKTNINCNGCIASVTPKLEAVAEISSWQVDTDNPDKILTVELDNSNPKLIKEAVESAGFSIEII